MNKKISTFVFDCFGVICTPVLYSWYNDNSQRYGFADDNLSNVLKQFDLDILGEDDILDYFLKYPGINLTKAGLRKDIDSYLKIDENLVATIKKLKAIGHKTALLSNGNHAFFDRKIYTTYPEFKSLFDEIVISSLVKMVKPDTEIYLHTLKLVDSAAEETIFIDDSKPNVDVAVSLGMSGFVFTDSQHFSNYLQKMGLI